MDSPVTIAVSLSACALLVALFIWFTVWYYRKGSASFLKALKENSFAVKRKVLYGYTALCIDTVNRQFAVQSAELDETGKKFIEPTYETKSVGIYGYESLLAAKLRKKGGVILIELTVQDGGEKTLTLRFISGYGTVVPFNIKSYEYAAGIAGRMERELRWIKDHSGQPQPPL